MSKCSKLSLIMGARNGAKNEREENDFYATHPDTTKAFLNKLQEDGVLFNNEIWECACGKGHISQVLKDYGYNVYSSDLIDRGYGEVLDFLACEKPLNLPFKGDIITNPPYKLAKEFAYKGLELLNEGNYLCFYLKLQFLEGKERKKLFDKYPPKYIYIHSERQKVARDGDFETYANNNSLAFCWVIWQKGYTGETITRWI